jgi:RNA polymerase sigma factor (sigma-70 family)
MATDADSFTALFARVRARDPRATAEFVRQYEPQLRRKVRNWLRLHYPYLCNVLDSVDVCQSVLAGFLLRVALGQYDLERAEDVWNLLVVMSRRRLRQHARDQTAARRDARRRQEAASGVLEAAAQGPSPSQEANARELLQAVRQRLTAEEWAVAERRIEGCSWAEAAAALGGTADARRMQLARALDRVARDLGLEEEPADGGHGG